MAAAEASLRKDAWNISGCNRSNYHLLSRALGQCVAVAQVINFNVLDIVSISNVDVCVKFRGCVSSGR